MPKNIILAFLFFCIGVFFSQWAFEQNPQKPFAPAPAPSKKQAVIVKASIQADVVRIIDGDSLEVKAFLWDGLEKKAIIRIKHINAPEKRRKSGCRICDKEKNLAKKARNHLARLIGKKDDGTFRPIFLRDIQQDDVYSRTLASITNADNEDIGDNMVKKGLAKRVMNGRKKACWCGILSQSSPPR